jgi:uncharacterized protein YndB with AHSA1/START domain
MAVKFDQHIDIDAPADVVWSALIDSTAWPRWLPDLEQVSNVSAVDADRGALSPGYASLADLIAR